MVFTGEGKFSKMAKSTVKVLDETGRAAGSIADSIKRFDILAGSLKGSMQAIPNPIDFQTTLHNEGIITTLMIMIDCDMDQVEKVKNNLESHIVRGMPYFLKPELNKSDAFNEKEKESIADKYMGCLKKISECHNDLRELEVYMKTVLTQKALEEESRKNDNDAGNHVWRNPLDGILRWVGLRDEMHDCDACDDDDDFSTTTSSSSSDDDGYQQKEQLQCARCMRAIIPRSTL